MIFNELGSDGGLFIVIGKKNLNNDPRVQFSKISNNFSDNLWNYIIFISELETYLIFLQFYYSETHFGILGHFS